MTVECIAIAAILVVVGLSYQRSQKAEYAWISWMLTFLPMTHLIGNLFFLRRGQVALVLDLISVLMTALLIGLNSARVQRRGLRFLIQGITMLYTLILFYLLNQSHFVF